MFSLFYIDYINLIDGKSRSKEDFMKKIIIYTFLKNNQKVCGLYILANREVGDNAS